MCFCFWICPTIFKYPAILFSFLTLGIKTLAVFIHGPEMKKLSLYLSSAECYYESSAQLLLLLNIWLSGGEMYLGAMVSSTIIIGKVGAERFLAEELCDKTFLDKLTLIVRYIPVFALTAIFRISSGAIILYHPEFINPLTPTFSIFLTWIHLLLSCTLMMLLLNCMKLWSKKLRKLSMVEIGQGIMGECTTINVWGDLGKEGSRVIQLGFATVYLCHNITYITWIQFENYKQIQVNGFNMWQTLDMEIIFSEFCFFIMFCGVVSYLLSVCQLFVRNF
jgi:hypothetical protein